MTNITVSSGVSGYTLIANDPVVEQGKSLMDRLAEPFRKQDLAWRLQRCGMKQGNIWAMAIVYVTSRAIQERLDEVVGVENWRNEYKPINVLIKEYHKTVEWSGFLCGLSIKINGEWITKWDGADNTEIESLKGGISGAFKRAAVPWGMGRYLYKMKESFIKNINMDKKFKNVSGWESGRTSEKQGSVNFYWKVPELDPWALHGDDSIYIDLQLQDQIRAYISNAEASIIDFRKAFNVKDASNIKKVDYNKCLDWIAEFATQDTNITPVRLA